jgi:hypothetical protein
MGKIIISESQFNDLIYSKLNLLTEASKLKILTDKEGLEPTQAELLDKLCGGLALWMFGKFRDYQKDIFKSWGKDVPIDKITVDKINENNLIGKNRQVIIDIMDWIRIGLDGNVKPFMTLSLKELLSKSKEWHDSLGVGQGKINFVEENPIIKDFRDEEGNGFYWVDLQTKNSPEECDRMGHCGRSSFGYLYSLREVKPLNNNYKLNKSHLTAAIGADGIMYQLKGPKNSKPKDEFHQYILPLFYLDNEDGEPLIQGFGTEYASEQDFKLSDLPETVIRELYQNRPELFKGRSIQRKLMDMGLIEKPEENYMVTIKIDPDVLGRYVDGDYVISRRKVTKKTPAGQEYQQMVETWLFESILGDPWNLTDNIDTGQDWKSVLDYHVNENNQNRIREMIKEFAQKDNPEFNEEEFNESPLEDLIEEYNYDDISNAILWAERDAASDSYVNTLHTTLKDCLEEIGKVKKMDEEGVTLEVDVEKYINELDDDVADEFLENCDGDLKCFLEEIFGQEYTDKPKFEINDYWYPDINDRDYNNYLAERLHEI